MELQHILNHSLKRQPEQFIEMTNIIRLDPSMMQIFSDKCKKLVSHSVRLALSTIPSPKINLFNEYRRFNLNLSEKRTMRFACVDLWLTSQT